MGWHYILNVECKILPAYTKFIEQRFLQKEIDEDKLELLPKSDRTLLEIWDDTRINYDDRLKHCVFFTEYVLEKDNIFRCEITKKVNRHVNDLWEDYLTFVKDILVPISEEIIFCRITSDDYGDKRRDYTDLELRNQHLSLSSLIRRIEHIMENGMIVETRVIYKHSIKKSLETDLTRCYL